jgi:hypothetical protein
MQIKRLVTYTLQVLNAYEIVYHMIYHTYLSILLLFRNFLTERSVRIVWI